MARTSPPLPSRRGCSLALWLCLGALFAAPAAPAPAPRRAALVIGNSRYAQLPALAACRNDAETMARTFRQLGMTLYQGQPLLDLTTEQMDDALRGFARTLDAHTEAFVYFTGHGTQLGGANYLLPVNFDAKYESQAKRQALSVDAILEALEQTDARLRIVILDACRDPGNLLPGEPVTKGLVRKGLSEPRVEAPETLVCFATKHGTAALADADASFYTRVLAEEMLKPGRMDDVLRIVARRVYAATEKQQLPFTYGALLEDHFFVRPVEPAANVVPDNFPKLSKSSPLQEGLFATPSQPGSEQLKTPDGNPAGTLQEASATAAFTNSLGMRFVPVPGTQVLFSIWETRVQDYEAFAQATNRPTKKALFPQEPSHPVVHVNFDDAEAFCEWLSDKEGRKYRLPDDHEWSCAVGIARQEEAKSPASKKSGKISGVYPWGTIWPPSAHSGNFGEPLGVDSYSHTAPVGSSAANAFGIFDLAGNVWELCDDWFNPAAKYKAGIWRGGSWQTTSELELRSSFRHPDLPAARSEDFGFRCVLEKP